MSAAEDAVKSQNAAAQAATQAKNEQQALDYFNAMDNFYLRQYTDQVNKELTDKIKTDEFENALKISDINKDAQIRAFDMSEQRYQDQLAINQAEYERAQTNISNQFDATLIGYQNQIADQDRAFQIEQDQASFDQDRLNRQKDQVRSQFEINTSQNALAIDRARDQLNQSSSLRDTLQGLRSTQLTDEFNLQARENELSILRSQDELGTRSTLRDAAEARQSGLLAQDRADIESQRQEILDTRVQADLIRQSQERAADLEDIRTEMNRDSQLANIAFQKQGQKIDSLVKAGQAKALGRKGVSAARTLQTTMALSGLNVARLTNQAFFVNKEADAAKQATNIRRDVIGFEDEISKIREAGQLGRLATNADRLTTQDTYQTAARKAEADADSTASQRLGTQQSLMEDVTQNRLSSQLAFNKANYDAESAADKTARERLASEESLLSTIAGTQQQFSLDEADQRLDEIAYAIGLSKEQLTMNKERLGESLAATTLSIDDQLLALEQNKFKADYMAHAARMLPPEFAPDVKAPYDVPLPKYIEPRPGAAPAPAYQAQYIEPPQQSGLGQALAIGGAALGIAAAPFTLGGSLGLGMGLGTAAAATATGTALAGVGAGLSQFSQMPFNYN